MINSGREWDWMNKTKINKMKAKFEFDLTPGGDDQYYYAMYSSAPALTEVYSELRVLRRTYYKNHESDTVSVEDLIKQLDNILDKSGIHEELYT
tara:strand:+ start:196 stop:477 length:282 start_codon:yes stop_codon:yes gene_type:complete